MNHLYVSAHPDDDLTFMSPSLFENVASNDRVWTAFMTSGDAGALDKRFWLKREEGERLAYSKMGVRGWRSDKLLMSGKRLIASSSLDDRVKLLFLRLPDGGCYEKDQITYKVRRYLGNLTGIKFPSQALMRIWNNENIKTIDGSNTYNRTELINTLKGIIQLSQANDVTSHDPCWVSGCDHVDHLFTGVFIREAAKDLKTPLILCRGYNCDLMPQNLSKDVFEKKLSIFKEYLNCTDSSKQIDSTTTEWFKRSHNRIERFND